MTELEVYKWVNDEDRSIELSWQNNELIIWIDFDNLSDFMEMFGLYFKDRIIDNLSLSDNNIALIFSDVLEFFGINSENIIKKES